MAFTQANRALRVTTPLGPDKLLITQFTGTERISELFKYELHLLAENSVKIEFDKLIGQKILVELDMPGKKKRFFSGICSRFSAGRRDDTFTHYRMEVVPQFWLLTRRVQSRIFQHITVPNILKEVLKGLDVKSDIKGNFFERDYCVQYRESDFAFASRMMEEEGAYYFFEHTAKGHTLVVANTPQGHVDLPEYPKAIYEEATGGTRDDMRIIEWEKVQELRSGKVTLWDHSFELPQQNLEAQKTILETVSVGKVTHKLKVADNDKLELYDYPGAYAQRFDGVDPGGGDRAADLKKIFEDNARVAKLHVEREAAASLTIRGASDCRQFCVGHRFTLERHFDADGAYYLTGVTHDARLGADYRSGSGDTVAYSNKFTCLPIALPFRPPLKTPKPTVAGTQTASVVGAAGEIITCDKYGRVKVQFHWDRQGKKDLGSSCWVRVSQNWGGAEWGGMFIPHHGQEVIVDFEEGDPDRPLIIGRVYNAESMPPLGLPANKTKNAIRDHGGNEIIMEGHGGVQQMRMHSPFANTTITMGAPASNPGLRAVSDAFFTFRVGIDWDVDVDGSHHENIKGHQKQSVTLWRHTFIGLADTEIIGAARVTMIGLYRLQVVGSKKIELVKGNKRVINLSNRVEVIKGSHTVRVMGPQNTKTGKNDFKVYGDQTITTTGKKGVVVDGPLTHEFKGTMNETVTGDYGITGKAKINVIAEGDELSLKCGASSLVLKNDGTISLAGKTVTITGTEDVGVGAKAKLNLNGDSETNMAGGKIDIGSKGAIKIHGNRIDLN